MKPKSRLIVFEGSDGVGKSELSRRCADHLNKDGVVCDYLAFPGRDDGTLGKLVNEIHHAPTTYGVRRMSPASLQLLHIAAHIDAVENRILPAIKAGRNVVLDRFWWSTLVYGKVAGADPSLLQAMCHLELVAWRDVRPDVVFLVERKAPLRPEPVAEWHAWSREYARLAAEERAKYPTIQISNDKSVEAVFKDVIAALDSLPVVRPPSAKASIPQSQSISLCEGAKPASNAPTVFSKLAPAKPTAVYDTYWRFAVERQRIFHKRAGGDLPPWTHDPILTEHKFTNAYRASDRVSQYLINHVIYKGEPSPEDVFFRTILFKLFNRIETWELLCNALGGIAYAKYKFSAYDTVLTRALDKGTRIYSAAYIMPSGRSVFGFDRKHRTHLKLIEKMMREGLPRRLADSRSMREAFELLRSYPTIGDFLAYQYVTDLNYSNLLNFTEMDFVVPGPGARDGIRKCFSDLGGLTEADLIRVVASQQQAEFERLGLKFQDLWGRPLQLIDCQNLFCEVDKYARVKHPEVQGLTGRTRIKQKFKPNDEPIQYWYPPKWGINERIKQGKSHDSTFLWR